MRNTWKACREETAKGLRAGKLGTLQVDAQCPSGAQCKMMSQACGTMWDRTQGQGFVKFTSKGCTRGDLHIFDTVLARAHSTAAISTAVHSFSAVAFGTCAPPCRNKAVRRWASGSACTRRPSRIGRGQQGALWETSLKNDSDMPLVNDASPSA